MVKDGIQPQQTMRIIWFGQAGFWMTCRDPVTSTVFPNVITTEPVPMELDDGKRCSLTLTRHQMDS